MRRSCRCGADTAGDWLLVIPALVVARFVRLSAR